VEVACKRIIKCIIECKQTSVVECHLRVQGFFPVCSCVLCVVVYVPMDGWAQKTRGQILENERRCLHSNYKFYDMLRCSCNYAF